MKKYNLSQIMTEAWNIRRMSLRWTESLSFGECLRRAWAAAKAAIREYTGIVRDVMVSGTLMHPVLVNIDMDNLSVTGNTFAARQLLRDLGLTWDRKARAWTGSRDQLNTICRKFAA